EEEEGGGGPSTSSRHVLSDSASEEEKKKYVEKQIELIVSQAKLNPGSRRMLEKAVKLVVCEGVSMASVAFRVGIPSSTMFPYVVKARTQLEGIVEPPHVQTKKRRMNGKKVESSAPVLDSPEGNGEMKKVEEATVDEISYVVNEVLTLNNVDKKRREKIYEILVDVLTGTSAPLEACKKRHAHLSSVASYLARARGRLGARLPKQKEDPQPQVEKEAYPYEKGTVVLAGQRLPQSMNEICLMITRGELSHIVAQPYEGTRAELKRKVQDVISRFRDMSQHRVVPDAVLRMLVDHVPVNEAADEFDIAPVTVGGYTKLMRMLIDVNDLTIVEEDGTKRVIPPRQRYERGKGGVRKKKKLMEVESSGDNEDTEEEEEFQ
ncbi:hypothetical protein PMAYCL1PPCAC_14284, partial [Pristionchus mayeri]